MKEQSGICKIVYLGHAMPDTSTHTDHSARLAGQPRIAPSRLMQSLIIYHGHSQWRHGEAGNGMQAFGQELEKLDLPRRDSQTQAQTFGSILQFPRSKSGKDNHFSRTISHRQSCAGLESVDWRVTSFFLSYPLCDLPDMGFSVARLGRRSATWKPKDCLKCGESLH